MKAGTQAAGVPASGAGSEWRDAAIHVVPFAAIFGFAAIVPMVTNDYWALIATRAAIYWMLVSGLNLIVGFAGAEVTVTVVASLATEVQPPAFVT